MPAQEITAAPWPRWRLFLGLAVVATVGLVLLGGLVATMLALLVATTPGTEQADVVAAEPSGDARRDAIAASSLPEIPRDAQWPHAPAAVPPPEITIPVSASTGPAGVSSGFPRTPEGALGQLAAIEVRVLEAMSIPVLNQVHSAWVGPGGPELAAWEMTADVQAFLGAVPHEAPDRIDDTTTVTVVPVGAQVKGTDGPDWVLACVMVEVRATVATDARMAYGHCARMVWANDRWLIAPGVPPAAVDGAWPGTQAFIDAGWKTWRQAS
jgi:hypothetical protein